MWRSNKLQLFFIQFLNYSFFEITLLQRIRFFYNHIYNSLKTTPTPINVSKIKLKKAFVISLNFREDRRIKINIQLKKNKLNYSFFDAYYLNNTFKQHYYFSNNSLKYLTHGSLGCAYSHLKLLESIANYEDDEYCIIFEDDVLLSREFAPKLNHLINNFPIDADLFFLGSRNERRRDYSYKCNYGYNKTYNARLGAYAYIVNSKGAKKIIELIRPLNLICGGIDTALGKLIRRNKIIAYQFRESIVFHNFDSLSNIYNPSAKRKKVHFNTITNWPQHGIKL